MKIIQADKYGLGEACLLKGGLEENSFMRHTIRQLCYFTVTSFLKYVYEIDFKR